MLLGIIAGLGPLSFVQAIRMVFNGDVLKPGHGNVVFLSLVVLGVLVVQIVANAASYGQNYLTAWSGQRLIANLRLRLFSRMMYLPLGEFEKWRPGEILARFSSDLQMMTDAIGTSLPQLLQTTVTFLGALVFMFRLDWLLTLFLTLVVAPFVSYTVTFFTRLIAKGSHRAQESIADLSANLSETLHGARVVKAFGLEQYEIGRLGVNNERYFNAFMKVIQFAQTQTPVVATLIAIGLLAIFFFSGREVMVGRTTPGDMFAFWTAVGLALNPINRFAALIGDLSRGLVGASRAFEILDLPVERGDEPGAIAPISIAGAIRFEHVTFAYEPDEPPVLQELSAEIEAGEIIALVGPSGAGKTTIVNLVPRFFEPQAGRITLDGIDLRNFQLKALRAAIGIVPQEPLLFSGTVADNIRYGKLDASDDEIRIAAREANAEEFIVHLPQGYGTVLGERGIRLSGGQRQRISIARAVLRDPRILILDEATSSLDSHSERLIEDALDQLLAGRTTLIIAHRLSTVRRAHKILYIDAGRVIEVGTHEDLVSRGGLYAQLHAAQFAL